MKYIAFTTKGIEKIAKKEINHEFPDSTIIDSRVKTILFETDAKLKELSTLKTVDDLCIWVREIDNLPNSKKAIDIISSSLKKIKVKGIISKLNSYREVKPNSFSITVGVYKTKYCSKELKKSLAEILASNRKWKYTSHNHDNLDIRISVTKNEAVLGIRATENSLHRRKYKKYSKKGSLRATIAAAMVLEAIDHKKNLKIVDNFCGSGTILCEALLTRNKVYGGDIDKESINITKQNLSNIRRDNYDIKHLNATKTSWQSNFFDCAISNLPWDKQIKIDKLTTLYSKAIIEYKRILNPNSTICLLGVKPDFLVSQIKKIFNYRNIKIIKLGYLGQNPSMVVAKAG